MTWGWSVSADCQVSHPHLADHGESQEAEGVAAAGGVEAGGDAGQGVAQVPGHGAVMTEDRPQPGNQVQQRPETDGHKTRHSVAWPQHQGGVLKMSGPGMVTMISSWSVG